MSTTTRLTYSPIPRQRGANAMSNDWRIRPCNTVEKCRRFDGGKIAAGSEVYFLQRAGDNLVKIGKALVLRYRITGIRKIYGPCVLLASEPGSTWVERFRHHQFEHLRAPAEQRSGGTEWFVPADDLLNLILRLNAAGVSP